MYFLYRDTYPYVSCLISIHFGVCTLIKFYLVMSVIQPNDCLLIYYVIFKCFTVFKIYMESTKDQTCMHKIENLILYCKEYI